MSARQWFCMVALLSLALLVPGSTPRSAAGPLAPQATPVSGIIATDTTWTLAAHPYLVNGSVTVAAGVTLTIEPGVVVKFASYSLDLWVDGTLIADTTPDAPIIYTSLRDDAAGGDTNGDGTATVPAPNDWGGLHFSATSQGSVLDYAIVRYGGGYYAQANVTLATAQITLTHNTIARSFEHGLLVDGASPTIEYNTLRDNTDSGVATWNGSRPSLWANEILSNTRNGVYSASGSQPTLRANQIAHNAQYGVYNADTAAVVDAVDNWWGTASGPRHPVLNPTGAGDAVSDGVLFSPWLQGLAIVAPRGELLHGVQRLEWAVYGRDATTLTVSVSVAGAGGTRVLGNGLSPSGTLDWDTRTAEDGWYDLSLQLRDGTSQLVATAGKRVLVLNGSGTAWHEGRIGAGETWSASLLHLVAADVTLSRGSR